MNARICLGDALGGEDGVVADTISLDAAAADVLAAVDALRGGLADDERLVFLLGYEACCALDPRAHPGHPHDPTLGPQTALWRMKLAPTTTTAAPTTAPSLRLRVKDGARERHLARVQRCREALFDGVIYQANLAHRLDVDVVDADLDADLDDVAGAGAAFFAARRQGVACAAMIDVDGWGSIISLSPERFVCADLVAGVAETFPIKGTIRRRGDDDDEIAALRASDKDRAEHVMIVDLLRNDLGKVAVGGGVTVESLMHIVSTPSVHHLETRITATLRPGVGVAELISSCSPGGSITGAPKSSAIDVIRDLEDGPRGAYTGVLGVVDGRGRLWSSLLIRTWLRPDRGPGALHVGGGVVVDSDPESEWQETLDKAAVFGVVEGG